MAAIGPEGGPQFHQGVGSLTTPTITTPAVDGTEVTTSSLTVGWTASTSALPAHFSLKEYALKLYEWDEVQSEWTELPAFAATTGPAVLQHQFTGLDALENGLYRVELKAIADCGTEAGLCTGIDSHNSGPANREFELNIASNDTWELFGFYRPVAMLGSEECNVVQRNRTVSLKFNVDKNGEPVTSVGGLEDYSLKVSPHACNGAGADIDEEDAAATGGTVLRWDSDAEQFVYNWPVGRTSGGVKVTLSVGGEELVAYFNIR